MQSEEFITVEAFCEYYHVELSFIDSLNDYGLIKVNSVRDKKFIPNDQLRELEKFIALHYDLDINVAGIDAIGHLLQKVKELQDEVASLRDKLLTRE